MKRLIYEGTNWHYGFKNDENLDEGTPVSIIFYELYGEDKNERIIVDEISAPAEGQAAPGIASTDELAAGTYKFELVANLNQENDQLLESGTIKVKETRFSKS